MSTTTDDAIRKNRRSSRSLPAPSSRAGASRLQRCLEPRVGNDGRCIGGAQSRMGGGARAIREGPVVGTVAAKTSRPLRERPVECVDANVTTDFVKIRGGD